MVFSWPLPISSEIFTECSWIYRSWFGVSSVFLVFTFDQCILCTRSPVTTDQWYCVVDIYVLVSVPNQWSIEYLCRYNYKTDIDSSFIHGARAGEAPAVGCIDPLLSGIRPRVSKYSCRYPREFRFIPTVSNNGDQISPGGDAEDGVHKWGPGVVSRAAHRGRVPPEWPAVDVLHIESVSDAQRNAQRLDPSHRVRPVRVQPPVFPGQVRSDRRSLHVATGCWVRRNERHVFI